MPKPNYFCTVDTETTGKRKVADFAAVVTDSKGRILNQCAILVDGIYTDMENHPLFTLPNVPPGTLWHKNSLKSRYKGYNQMVKAGTRHIASVNAINRWLLNTVLTYPKIVLTAYNLDFDSRVCSNTAIDLGIFERSFCMYKAASATWSQSKKYKRYCLLNHRFNNRTDGGNMAYQFSAESVSAFLRNDDNFPPEPHTALEDILDYEILILENLIKRHSVKSLLGHFPGHDWRKVQVRDHYKEI